MNALKTLAVSLLAVTLAAPTPSFAWGDNEQKALLFALGVAAGKADNHHQRQERYAPAPRYEPRYQQQYSGYIDDGAAADAFYSLSPRARRGVQLNLADRGYYRGRADGEWGPRTWGALQDFAADHGSYRALGSYNGTMRVLGDLML